MKKTSPKTPSTPNVRARFFATSPHVTTQIQEWAAQHNVRILAIVPVYTEDSEHDQS